MGDRKKTENTVGTVTLTKGALVGFRTVGRARKGYAGETEFALPEPLPTVVVWEFCGREARGRVGIDVQKGCE